MTGSTVGALQRRGAYNVGPFHVYAGEQLAPHAEMVVGHAHDQPHLMVMTRSQWLQRPPRRGGFVNGWRM
jgi:hypothetical protein